MLKTIIYNEFQPKISFKKALNNKEYDLHIFKINNNIIMPQKNINLYYERRINLTKQIGFLYEVNEVNFLSKLLIMLNKIKKLEPQYLVLDLKNIIINQSSLNFIIQQLNILLDNLYVNNIKLVLIANEYNLKIVYFIINNLKYIDTKISIISNKEYNQLILNLIENLNIKENILFLLFF